MSEIKAPAPPPATFPIVDPTKREEIQKHSMLDEFQERGADPIGSFKGLVNTCLPSSTPAKFDQMGGVEAAEFFQAALSHIQGQKPYLGETVSKALGVTRAVLDDLQQQIEGSPEERAAHVAKTIEDLEEGKSCFMTACHDSSSGVQTVFIQFEKVSGAITIRVFDSWQETEDKSLESTRHKARGVSYMEFANVGVETLLADKGLILVNLAKTGKEENLPISLAPLFAPLRGYLQGSEVWSSGVLMALQRSGNPTTKSFNALLHHVIHDSAQYKRLALEIRLYALQRSYYALCGDGDASMEVQGQRAFMLKQSVKKYLKLVTQRHQLFPDEKAYLASAATAMDLLNNLEDFEKNLLLKPECEVSAFKTPPLVEGEVGKISDLQEKLQKELHIGGGEIYPAVLTDLGKGVSWESLAESLTHLNANLKSLVLSDRIVQIELFTQQIRGLKNQSSFQKLPLKQRQAIAAELTIMVRQYIKDVSSIEGLAASRVVQNTLMEAVAVGCLISGNNVAVEDVSFKSLDLMERLSNLIGFDIQDPIVLEHRNELAKRFKEMGGSAVAPKEFPLVGFPLDELGKEVHQCLSSIIKRDGTLFYTFTNGLDYLGSIDSYYHCAGLLRHHDLEREVRWTRKRPKRERERWLDPDKEEPCFPIPSREVCELAFTLTTPFLTARLLLDGITAAPQVLKDSIESKQPIEHFFYKTLEGDMAPVKSPLFETIRDEGGDFVRRLNRMTDAVTGHFFHRIKTVAGDRQVLNLIYRLRSKFLCSFLVLNPGSHLNEETVEKQQMYLGHVDHLMKDPSLSEAEMQELRLTKFYLLFALQKDRPTLEGDAALFLLMADIKNTPASEKREVSLEQDVLRLYHELLDQRKEILTQDPSGFANAVFKLLDREAPVDEVRCEVGVGGPTISAVSGGIPWDFRLSDLSVFYDGKRMEGKNPLFYPNHAFMRLFGNDSLERKIKAGEYLLFTHKRWGEIRVTLDKQQQVQRIEKQFEGVWHTYTEELGHFSVNPAILSQHACWLNPNKQDLVTMRLCGLSDGEVVYEADSKGSIYLKTSHERFCPEGLKNQPLGEFFARFEDLSHISVHQGETVRITLSRFVSAGGAALEFEWDQEEQKWCYSQNKEYFLDSRSLFSGNISRSLELIRRDGLGRKVLLPIGELSSRPYSKQCEVQLSDTTKTQFLDLDVEGEEIRSNSLNESLYLAAVYLAQKNYEKALNQLQRISQSDLSDKTSWIYFEKFLMGSEALFHDPSPNAAAVRLHAFIVMRNIKSHESTLLSQLEALERDYRVYSTSSKGVDKALRVSSQRLKEVKKIIEKSKGSNRYDYSVRNKNRDDWWISFSREDYGNLRKYEQVFPEKFFENERFKEMYEAISRGENLPALAYRLVYAPDGLEKEERDFLLLCIEQKRQKPESPLPEVSQETWLEVANELFGCPFFQEKETTVIWLPQQDVIDANKRDVIHANKREVAKERYHFGTSAVIVPRDESQLGKLGAKLAAVEAKGKARLEEGFDEAVKSATSSAPRYESAIAAHLEEYKKGREIALEAPGFEAQKEGGIEAIASFLKEELPKVQEKEADHFKSIMGLIAKRPADPAEAFRHETQRMAVNKPNVEIAQICQAAVSEDWGEKLHKLNRFLSKDEIVELRSRTIAYMFEVTYGQHLSRVQKFYNDYEADPTAGNYKLLQKEVLSQRRYEMEEVFYLYFEYKSGLRLREKQFGLIVQAKGCIEKGDYGMAFQLMMAGGKTTMILPTLLELFAEKGKLVCALCHYSQEASLKGSLSMQRERFGKDLITLSATLQELSNTGVLLDLLDRVKRARKQRCPLLIISTFPQLLLAKFQADCVTYAETRKEPPHLPLLAQLIQELRRDSVAFIDECDSTLSMMTEVHLPLNSVELLPADETKLVSTIYQSLLSPSFREKLGLLNNEQQDKSKNYQAEILPHVVQQWMLGPGAQTGLSKDLLGALARHMSGQIGEEDQALADDLNLEDLSALPIATKENILLLRELKRRITDTNPVLKRKAELIGVARHVFLKVLPTALSRSYNRHYGPIDPQDRTHDRGEIIPYQGAWTPARTKFGDPYLALALSIQAALGSEIVQSEIKFLADKLVAAGTSYSAGGRTPLENTPEVRLLKKLTNVSIEELENPDFLDKAFAFINDPKHPERRLAFRSESSAFHVKYFPKEVSCTPLDLIEFFPQAIAFSGTLYNHPSYHKKLGEPILDEGTEGSIINCILEEGPQEIVEVKNQSHKLLFEKMRNSDEPQKVRALIDAGGFLKDVDNATMAEDLLEVLPHIKGVVYLPNGGTSFYLLKRGVAEPIRLLNTSPEELARHVALEDMFVLYHELGTTGTNIHMAKDTVCFQTVNSQMPMRTLLQGALRARQFFEGQKVQLVMTPEGRKGLLHEGQDLRDLSYSLEKNEAIAVANQTLYSYMGQGKIKRKQPVLEELIGVFSKKNKKNIKKDRFFEIMDRSAEQLITAHKFSNYENWLFVEQEQDTLEWLGKQFGEDKPLLEQAAKDPFLPDKIQAVASSTRMDQEVEIELEIAVDIEMNQEQELTLELTNELMLEANSYKRGFILDACEEECWLTVADYRRERNSKAVSSFLKDKILQYSGKDDISTGKYADCFSDNLFVSTNLIRSSKGEGYIGQDIVFEERFKPVCFVLVEAPAEGQPMRFTLLTKFDGEGLVREIAKKPPENSWLLDLNGETGVSGHEPSDELRDDPEFLKGLWQANLFAGQISYLEDHSDFSVKMLEEYKENGQDELVTRYLFMKNYHKPCRRAQLLRSRLFQRNLGMVENLQKNQVICSLRREEFDKDYLNIRAWTPETIAAVDPAYVPILDIDQIKYLQTPEQFGALPAEMANYVNPELADLLLPNQAAQLTSRDIIRQLTKLELIQAVSVDQARHIHFKQLQHILPTQIRGLTVKQMRRVPQHIYNIASDEDKGKIQAAIQKEPKMGKNFGDWKVALLSPLQMDLVPKAMVERLPEGIIERLSEKQVTPKFFQQLTEGQVGRIPHQKVKEWLIGGTQNNAYVAQRTNFSLTEEDVRDLVPENENLFPYLSADQVNRLPADFIQKIKPTGFDQFKPEQITDHLVEELSDGQVKQITHERVKGWLKVGTQGADQRLQERTDFSLTEDDVRNLGQDDGKLVSFVTVNHPELIKALPEDPTKGLQRSQAAEFYTLFTQDQKKWVIQTHAKLGNDLSNQTISELSQPDMKQLYGAKGFFSNIFRPIGGLFRTAFAFPALLIGATFHLALWIPTRALGLFSGGWKASAEARGNKLGYVIRKNLLAVVSIFSYPKYRSSLAKLNVRYNRG